MDHREGEQLRFHLGDAQRRPEVDDSTVDARFDAIARDLQPSIVGVIPAAPLTVVVHHRDELASWQLVGHAVHSDGTTRMLVQSPDGDLEFAVWCELDTCLRSPE